MQVHLIAIGRGMPAWVASGFQEYQRRLGHGLWLELHEVHVPAKGKRQPAGELTRQEGEKLLARVPKDAQLVALDERGKSWTTRELSLQLDGWLQAGRPLALLVGGADGHGDAVRRRARQSWSLSPLTLPHMLVRVVVAEQLYRAWSLLQGHPYHRG